MVYHRQEEQELHWQELDWQIVEDGL